jgi:hypothetical protein
MEERRSSALPILIGLLLLSLPPLVYFSWYFARSDTRYLYRDSAGKSAEFKMRHYPTPWEATIFQPAAKLESIVTGKNVICSPVFIVHDSREL